VGTENVMGRFREKPANEAASPFREIMTFGFNGLNDKKDRLRENARRNGQSCDGPETLHVVPCRDRKENPPTSPAVPKRSHAPVSARPPEISDPEPVERSRFKLRMRNSDGGEIHLSEDRRGTRASLQNP
jgi:hypothetical protein